jgi:hypothetical protein
VKNASENLRDRANARDISTRDENKANFMSNQNTFANAQKEARNLFELLNDDKNLQQQGLQSYWICIGLVWKRLKLAFGENNAIIPPIPVDLLLKEEQLRDEIKIILRISREPEKEIVELCRKFYEQRFYEFEQKKKNAEGLLNEQTRK